MSHDNTSNDNVLNDESPEEPPTTISISARAKRRLKIAAATTGGIGLVVLGYVLGSNDDEDSDEDPFDDLAPLEVPPSDD